MAWVEGEVVARGATAEVVRGPEGIVHKDFEPQVPLIAVEIEAAGTRVAHAAGLAVPRVVGVDEGPPARLSLSFVAGKPLGELVGELGPVRVGDELARTQVAIHDARVPAGERLLAAATFFAYHIDHAGLEPRVKGELQAELASLPRADTLVHLDLHPMNVMWDGERAVIIDWMNARTGPAAADVARTRVILESLPHQLPDVPEVRRAIGAIEQAYLAAMRLLDPPALRASDTWMRVTRAARLAEKVTASERAALLASLGV